MQLHPDALVPADRLRTNRYQLTNLGRRVAVLFTKTYGRVLAPGLSVLDPHLPEEVTPGSSLGTAWRCFEKAFDDFMQAEWLPHELDRFVNFVTKWN